MTDLLALVRENCTELQQHIISLKYAYGLTWSEMAEALKDKFPQYATPDQLKWVHGTTKVYLRKALKLQQETDATPEQPDASSREGTPTA